jgi:hypothetical protein
MSELPRDQQRSNQSNFEIVAKKFLAREIRLNFKYWDGISHYCIGDHYEVMLEYDIMAAMLLFIGFWIWIQ